MKPVFISACGRSGTTLLGAMLGTHDRCLTTPESKFILPVYRASVRQNGQVDAVQAIPMINAHWGFKVFGVELEQSVISKPEPIVSYSELIKWIVRQYGQQNNRPLFDIWVDHTPNNVIYTTTLFDLFPDAKMIHLIRDGRAVAASVMKLDWGPNTINVAASWWTQAVAHGLAAESCFGAERVKQVRYETLIVKPEETLQDICAFLQIEYQPEMVDGTGFKVPAFSSQGHTLVGRKLEADRATAWQQELTPRQIEIFESLAGNLLRCLGYDLMYGVAAREPTKQEKILFGVKKFLMRQIIGRFRHQKRIQRAISATAARKVTYTEG